MNGWLKWAGVTQVLVALVACGDDDGASAGVGGGSGAGGSATVTATGGTSSGETSTSGSGAGSSSSGGQGGGGEGGSTTGTRPHPLYPPLDLDTLPGDGGAQSGPYAPPDLPQTTETVSVTSSGAEARAAIQTACATPGTSVTVPDSAGALGVLDLGNVSDCDISLGDAVTIDLAYIGHLPGPVVAPVQRVRIRGGQIGSIMVDPGSTDVVFDGVTLNSGILPAGQRPSVGIYLIDDGTVGVERFAFVRSVLRMAPTVADGAGNVDGCAYLAGRARDVFFADNNIVTAGNRNAWGFRLSGGDNFVAVDNAVRVSFHKLIRMNDGPVDYVYVKGGIWMREETLTADGTAINDSFAQLGDLGTDRIYLHDLAVHLLSPEVVSFGASFGPGQIGKRWEARRIAWHARSEGVVSDALLGDYASFCDPGAVCDYGVGTHTYAYDPAIALPENPWRSLPVPIDDPDALPVAP